MSCNERAKQRIKELCAAWKSPIQSKEDVLKEKAWLDIEEYCTLSHGPVWFSCAELEELAEEGMWDNITSAYEDEMY